MPIKSSKIRDARPSIKAEAESEKGLFTAKVQGGSVIVNRGGIKNSFALKYGEVSELQTLLTEVDDLLTKNQYHTDESLSEGYEAGAARYVPPAKSGGAVPESAGTEETPTVSVATTGVPAAVEAAPADEPAPSTVDNPQTPSEPFGGSEDENPFA